MNRGLFITIEGPDGSGKSTQASYIKEYMRKNNIDCIFTREPGGTPISEKIRAIILDRNNSEIDPMTETLLYAASRSQLTMQIIKPALAHGKTVVCDRFVDSSVAYQQYARDMGKAVSIINEYATGGLMPDVTFFLNITPDVSLKRLSGGMDRMESETMAFHRAVYEGYLALKEKHPERIVDIDAGREPLDVWAQIEERLERLFGV